MKTSEEAALGRVLAISREAYSAVKNGETELNQVALLDALSAALSHVNNEKKPLAKCMRALKSEIKRAGKPFYERVKPQFSPIVPIPQFDFTTAMKHIPAIIYGNDQICQKLVSGEIDKACSMADAMKSYPGFLYGEFEALTPAQFYELVFGYYPKIYDEPFMEQMKELCGMAAVSVKIKEQEQGLYVKCKIKTEADMITSVIRGTHTNLVYLEKNGKIIYEKNQENGQASDNALIETLKQMTIAQIRQVADTASEEELHFLMDGVEMNERLAAYSENKKVGVGIADTLRSEKGSEVLKNDLLTRIMLKVSSAAESRLDGCPLPTMSSSGAGTKGLVVILPVSEAADALGVSMEKKVRALAIAHLVNRYINAYIGKLSPMCSCVMASSTAASVGIAYLLGGSDEQLGYAVRNMSGTVTGMICDGGKVGCAMKVAAGSSAALLCALTAVHDAPLRVSDGICAETPEDCIRHMAQIGNQGMAQTDKEIIHIMEQKK